MLDLFMLLSLVTLLGAAILSPFLFLYITARGFKLIFRRKRGVAQYAKL